MGIAAGTCYYLAEEGVWKKSEESVKLYDKIGTAIDPYVKEVSKELPFKIPDLPDRNRISYLAVQYWNCGVMTTFKFLSNLDDHVTNWTKSGYQMISDNPEVKKFIDSLTAAPSSATTEESKTK